LVNRNIKKKFKSFFGFFAFLSILLVLCFWASQQTFSLPSGAWHQRDGKRVVSRQRGLTGHQTACTDPGTTPLQRGLAHKRTVSAMCEEENQGHWLHRGL
jgi:hypothetical protein